MESNFIKKPINGFVNTKERIPAFFLDQKAPEVSPVKMSNLALKNGRTSPRRITGNDSQRAPRGHSAVQRGPLRSNARLLTNRLQGGECPAHGRGGGLLSSLGWGSLKGPGMLEHWGWGWESSTRFGTLRKTHLEIMLNRPHKTASPGALTFAVLALALILISFDELVETQNTSSWFFVDWLRP